MTRRAAETPGSGAADFRAVNEVQDAKAARKQRQAFYTPLPLVDLMVKLADLWPSCRALEPSAGDGRIVHAMQAAGVEQVDVCELDDTARERLLSAGLGNMVAGDFLAYRPEFLYERIVMNPPFKGKTFVRHLEHAWSMLAPNGQLIALAPTTAQAMLARCELDFPECEWADGEVVAEGWFKEYGANVSVLLIEARRLGAQRIPVLGFSNHATCNAALSIETDRRLAEASRDVADADALRSLACDYIAAHGGSCYGVDWSEVLEHLRSREAVLAGEIQDEPAAEEAPAPGESDSGQFYLFNPKALAAPFAEAAP